MSHVNQTDQYGDTSAYSNRGTYTYKDPISGNTFDIPLYSQQTQLAPGQQAIFNQGEADTYGLADTACHLLGQASNNLSHQFRGGRLNLPTLNVAKGVNDLISNTGAGAWEQPLNYQWKQQRDQLNQSLADQGFSVNDAGWNKASNNLDLSQNLQGDHYAQQMYGTANQAVQQEYQNNASAAENQFSANEQAAQNEYNMPLNELNALISGSQVKDATFQPTATAQIPTTDYAGIVQNSYQDALQGYQAQNQANQAQNGGMFGLAGSIIGGGLSLF
jgi:hypothetical protein